MLRHQMAVYANKVASVFGSTISGECFFCPKTAGDCFCYLEMERKCSLAFENNTLGPPSWCRQPIMSCSLFEKLLALDKGAYLVVHGAIESSLP